MARSRPKFGTSKSVSRGRPPLAKAQKPALSAKATRTLIRTHHNLLKVYAAAVASNDTAKAASIRAEIEAKGGLESYQLASTLGQSNSRGGDSSKVLVDWLKIDFDAAQAKGERLRMLEVGALSTKNACSKVRCLDIDRIDLHSQAPEIREIDFMDLPIPETEAETYQIVSLSLVLNFVPEPSARGEMLKRIPKFLQSPTYRAGRYGAYLFLVLPLHCITNSRYMNERLLNSTMHGLGFSNLQIKRTSKLHYSLWRYNKDRHFKRRFPVEKKEINPGGRRNNFSIVLL